MHIELLRRITLRLKDIWRKDSSFAGWVYLAASAGTVVCKSGFHSPTECTSPENQSAAVFTAGLLTDRIGSAQVVCASLILAIPWVGLLAMNGSLAGFIVFFCLYDVISTGVWPATGRELATVGKSRDGISEIRE